MFGPLDLFTYETFKTKTRIFFSGPLDLFKKKEISDVKMLY